MKKVNLLVLLALAVLPLGGCWKTSSDTSYTGYVTGVAKSGVFWQTGQVWSKTEVESSQEYLYCVEDELVYGLLKEYEKNKEQVTMVLDAELFRAPWRCNEGWRVLSVAPAMIN